MKWRKSPSHPLNFFYFLRVFMSSHYAKKIDKPLPLINFIKPNESLRKDHLTSYKGHLFYVMKSKDIITL